MSRSVPLIAACLALTGCGGNGDAPEVTPPTEAQPPGAAAETTPGGTEADGRVVVDLAERDGSGLSGRAELTPDEGSTTIVVELDDPEALPAGVYLQEGDCTALNPETAEVLALFLEGRSETVVDTELTQLVNGRFVIAVYLEETEDLQQPDACGEITAEGA